MATATLEAKAVPRGRAAEVVRRWHRLQAAVARALAMALERFFQEQGRRAARRYLDMAKGPSAHDLLPPEEERLLVALVDGYLLEVVVRVGEMAGEMVGVGPYPEGDPRVQAILAEAGTRIRAISETTRQAVRELLMEANRRGYNTYQTAYGVPREGFPGISGVVAETYRGRAETIARTEVAWASQRAAHGRYQEAGVTEVDVWDGPDCGLTRHDDPEKVNGKRYPLAVIEQYPIAHPNCRRVSMPVLPR